MKQLLLTLLLLGAFTVFGQQDGDDGPPPEEKKKSREIYNRVENMPEFPGGEEALNDYLIQYGVQTEKYADRNSNTVVVTFVVEADGALNEISILKGLDGCLDCQRRLIAIIKSLPDWNPGKQQGKEVPVKYNLPVRVQPDFEKMREPPGNQSKPPRNQTNPKKSDSRVYTKVQQMPEFENGEFALKRYIRVNKKIPDIVREKLMSGSVIVDFVVKADGSLTDIALKESMKGCPECDEEAIRIVKAMPAWIPGKQDNRAVDVFTYVKISFRHDED